MKFWKQSGPKQVREITPAELSELAKLKLDNADRFEAILDTDSAVLRDLSLKTGIDRTRIAQLLANSLQESAKPITRSFLRHHWADFLVAAIILLMIFEIAKPWISQQQPTITVLANTEIPSFSVIEASQLKAEGAASKDQAKQSLDAFVGGYSMTTIHKGDTIPTYIARVKSGDLSDRSIIRMKVKSMPPLDSGNISKSVDLVFPPKESVSAITISALLLGVDNQNSAVTVAVKKSDVPELLKHIGSADIHLLLHFP